MIKETMEHILLDLLDAITDVRVKNPEMRASVLAALRLTSSENMITAGRLYVLRENGDINTIISHGGASITEENDREIVSRIQEQRELIKDGVLLAYPLGKDKRLYGVLILEEASENIGHFLSDLFLQWSAVADFIKTEKEELLDENYHLREEIRMQYSEHNIISVSGAFCHVLDSARRVASSTATVLISGETGTGKELIARMVHQNSQRANEAFITVNCGALSENLLESELFGHVKGAFTGAINDRKGRFESANKGTIFLDEIGEISEGMQVRLLRVLQEMEVIRVGEHKVRKLDVRVIAATNRDLEEEVKNGNFRADLYYRLNVVYLPVPALRHRSEDIPPLVEHFLSVYCQRNCKYIENYSRDIIELMKCYPWPGNVRELENCVEKLGVMAPGRELTPDLLPMAIMAYNSDTTSQKTGDSASLNTQGSSSAPQTAMDENTFETMVKEFMQENTERCHQEGSKDLYNIIRCKWERYLFEAVLTFCQNNKSKAAQLLGITRNTLNSRLNDISTEKREWTI
ncbi:MAG: sigma-54-dependent Fis family transcriptional regulator [Planctomycetes bacterium]|nr:sigma-54-dependent Fis family transcriptional regulator [Planctomycetota bacterium]